MYMPDLRLGANGSRILLALDGLSILKASEISSELSEHVAGCKLNDLVDRCGSGALSNAGFAIRFVDAKIHDIKNTVENRLRSIHLTSPVDIVTVHAAMSAEALRAAAIAGDHYRFAVIAVTLLTDISPEDCRSLYGVNPEEMVRRLTIRARDAGVHGIVCSPKETRMVRDLFPKALIVNPGVRLAGSEAHDQARIGTPEQAIRDGADLLVVGRDILGEDSRSARLRKLLKYNSAVNDALAFI